MPLAHRFAAVLGGVLLNLAFGGLYAYSALVPALERTGALSRADTAMVFALSTTSFMFGVWVCSHLIRRWSIPAVAILAGTGAASGLLICSWYPELAALVLGYSGIYGACAGVGYALSLAGLAGVTMKRPGMAAGVVVSAFAVGSACWAQGLSRASSSIGVQATFANSALFVVLLAGTASLALWFSRSTVASNRAPQVNKPTGLSGRSIGSQVSAASLWVCFFGIAAAGLTVIGQALQLLGKQGDVLVVGLSIVALAGGANGLGRLAGGAMADRLTPLTLLGSPLLMSVFGLGLLAVGWNPISSYLAVLVIAAMYGWCSAAIPAVVMSIYGKARFSAVYGRVFTAWGLAGLVVPWAAGWAYAKQGSYASAMLVISMICLLALGMLAYQECRNRQLI